VAPLALDIITKVVILFLLKIQMQPWLCIQRQNTFKSINFLLANFPFSQFSLYDFNPRVKFSEKI
jgi:hypothetical protein